MKAVRCQVCHLLVGQDTDDVYGSTVLAIPGNHAPEENEEGFARLTETAECDGSQMLGYVETVREEQ